MGTKLVMTVAAIATAGAGLVLLFLPQEVVGLAGGPPASTPALAMQLMGASAHPQAATWIAAAVYAVLAVLFSVTMVRGP